MPRRLALACSVVLALAGCDLNRQYVEADRQTHTAFRPLVDRAATQGERDLYAAWGWRVDAAERSLPPTTQPAAPAAPADDVAPRQ